MKLKAILLIIAECALFLSCKFVCHARISFSFCFTGPPLNMLALSWAAVVIVLQAGCKTLYRWPSYRDYLYRFGLNLSPTTDFMFVMPFYIKMLLVLDFYLTFYSTIRLASVFCFTIVITALKKTLKTEEFFYFLKCSIFSVFFSCDY